MPRHHHPSSPTQQIIDAHILYARLDSAQAQASTARVSYADPDKAPPVLDMMVFTFGAASLALAIVATLFVQPQSMTASSVDTDPSPEIVAAAPAVL